MGMFSASKRSVVALLLGIVGLCAAPVGAQKPPRLLFLGISKDGRPSLTAENAVQLRLRGLTVEVIRANETPPCAQEDCLAVAVASGRADLVLTGRILRNDHACLATLWLAVTKGQARSTEQDIACRFDGKDDDLGLALADGAASLIEDYLRRVEPTAEKSELKPTPAVEAQRQVEVGKQKRLSSKKKVLIAGLGILLVGGITATITFASIDPTISPCSSDMCFNIMSYRSATAISGLASAAILAPLLYISIK